VEIAMEHRRRRRTQTLNRQLDFLDPKPPPARGATPQWSSLPQPTRCALTGLVTRLLVDHAGGETRDRGSCADDV
jgi:hypothetical protein